MSDVLSARLAALDTVFLSGNSVKAYFAKGNRPLVRWVASHFSELPTIRASIHGTTRSLGQQADYCLCTTYNISPNQARDVLSVAVEPVEWRLVSYSDNISLTEQIGFENMTLNPGNLLWGLYPTRIRECAHEILVMVNSLHTETELRFMRPMLEAQKIQLQLLEPADLSDGVSRLTLEEPIGIHKYQWLGGSGQWGVPGWTSSLGFMASLYDFAKSFKGKQVLELGTSRGKLSAMLNDLGCLVTTVDQHDRGASSNLAETFVNVVQSKADDFLKNSEITYDLIVVDVHGNSPSYWQALGPLLIKRLSPNGVLFMNNYTLYLMSEWRDETGVYEFVQGLSEAWQVKTDLTCLPGWAIAQRAAYL